MIPTPHAPIRLRTLSPIDDARPRRTIAIRTLQAPDVDVPIFIPGQLEDLSVEHPVTWRRALLDKAVGLAYILVGLVTVPLFLYLFTDFRKHETPSAIQNYAMLSIGLLIAMRLFLLAKNRLDTRRPVLFLRSHQDDGMTLEKGFVETLLTPVWRNQIGASNPNVTLETLLEEELRGYGRTVALRGPTEAERGARDFRFTRHSTEYEAWQKEIFHQINRSSLVVIVLGTRESLRDRHWGVGWEIDTLVAMDLPSKVLLLFPPVPPEELLARWTTFLPLAREVGLSVPETLPPDPICGIFSPDWTLHLQPHHGRDARSYRKALRATVVDLDLLKGRLHRAVVGAFLLGVAGLTIAWYCDADPSAVTKAALYPAGLGAAVGFAMRSAW